MTRRVQRRYQTRPLRGSRRLIPTPTSKTLIELAADSVVPGTTRLTNLTTTLETAYGDDMAGTTILSVRGWGTLQSTSTGLQDYTCALFIGPETLDVADIHPGTGFGEEAWWMWQFRKHRGTSHNLTSAVSERDVYSMFFRTRGRRKLARTGRALFFAEEATGQTQSAGWTFLVSNSR